MDLSKTDPNIATIAASIVCATLAWLADRFRARAAASLQRRINAALGEARSVFATIIATARDDMTAALLEQQLKGAVAVQLAKLRLDPDIPGDRDSDLIRALAREAIAEAIAAWVAKHPAKQTLVMPAVARQG